MQLKRIVILLVVITLLSVGCKNNKSNVTRTKDDTDAISTQLKQQEKDYSVSKDYSDKTRLVWVTSPGIEQNTSQIYKEFNRRLVEMGYDFVVDFQTVTEEGGDYQQAIRDMKQKGNQADLLYSDLGFGGQYSTTYDDCVRDGLYEPLNSYFETKQGKQFYNGKDPRQWKSVEINDTCYGIDNRDILGYSTYFLFNKKLLDKYQIDLSSFDGNIQNLEWMLQKVYEGEKSNKSFTVFPIEVYINNLSCYDYVTNAVGVRLGTVKEGALNIFDDDNMTQYFTAIKKYHDLGYLRSTDGIPNNFFVTMNTGLGPESYSKLYFKEIYIDQQGQPIDLVPVKLSDAYMVNLYNGVTGIASWSQHKKEAFELLTLLNSDTELANLLVYGMNGTNYELVDGKVIPNKNAFVSARNTSLLPNLQIIYPNEIEPLTKERDLKEYQKTIKESPILGFHFNPEKVINEIKATDAIVNKYSMLWIGEEDNLEVTLKQLNIQLKKAGIDKVVSEMNKQLGVWKKG